MKIPVILIDFSGEVNSLDTQWDMTLIKDIIEGQLWQPVNGYQFNFLEDYRSRGPYRYGMVVIVPARQNAGHEVEIQDFIKELPWCLLILAGDEERAFDYSLLYHPHMKLWIMQPELDDKADFFLGSGYTPNLRENAKLNRDSYLHKGIDWSFMGQNNHVRRQLAADVMFTMLEREDLKGVLHLSDGFTQGLPQEEYYRTLLSSKAVAAPSGVESPDSFRVFEALESGAIPVADDISKHVTKAGYWRKVFNGEDIPFAVLTDYANLEGYLSDIIREYPMRQNRVFAWWQKYKRRMVYELHDHIKELSKIETESNDILSKITVLILTSPIYSHPDTTIIDQTIADIRSVLPDSEIIIGIDGVRPEQSDYLARYEEYKSRLLWKTNYEWSNVVPVVFEEHMHQAAMTRELLKLVKTPTILFVEHDTALAPDFKYDWQNLVKVIEDGEAYTIRFHHEASILEDHEHMMIGGVDEINSIPMRKTYQWSQRPHLSSTVFYRDMIDRYFNAESRTMIEDVVHGKVIEDFETDNIQGWYKWRLWIYHPGGNIKRSYTTNGRGDDPKFEMRF